MDRICPFLALRNDPRSAVDGFDPDHRCLAVVPNVALERQTQAGLCLHEGHRDCARFKQAAEQHAVRRALPRPAPDATFVSTRLILESDSAWRGVALAGGSTRRPGRIALTGASAILLLGAAAAAASTNAFGLIPASSVATQSPTTSPSPTTLPSPSVTASPLPTSVPTAIGTPTLAPTASPVRTPAPTARPTRRTYVVQSGDTLSSIATRFGITVQALAAANNLDPNKVINIGQVLVIP